MNIDRHGAAAAGCTAKPTASPALIRGSVRTTCSSFQTLCQGIDRRRDMVVAALVDLVKPRGILARATTRKCAASKALDETIEVLYGDVPEIVRVREGRIFHDVDVRRGQKTGPLPRPARESTRPPRADRARGLRASMRFSYHGGFCAADGGPTAITSSPSTPPSRAVEVIGTNARPRE